MTDHSPTIDDPRVLELFERLPLAVAAVDQAGRVLLINRRATEWSGYTIEDTPTLAQWRKRAFPDEHYRTQVTDGWDKSVAEAAVSGTAIEPRDIHVVDKWGRVRTASIMGIPFGGGFLAAFYDHTDRLQQEAQLREAQKLLAVSTLAGGIAHEFNNLLAVMLMQFNALLASRELPPALADKARDMEAVLQQARLLISELLRFARQPAANHGSVELADIVADVARLVRPSLPADVELHIDQGPNAQPVLADRVQITQLLMNLVMNAFHAMQGRRGCVRIAIESVDGQVDGAQLPSSLPPRMYQRLSVIDQGCGIDPEVQQRIFEPFFTTRPPGQGTGLGLAVVQGIVRAHGGAIRLDSRLQEGTTFDIFLPAPAAS